MQDRKFRERNKIYEKDIVSELCGVDRASRDKHFKKYRMSGGVGSMEVEVRMFPQRGWWKVQVSRTDIEDYEYSTRKFYYKENAFLYFNYLSREYDLS